SLGHQFQQFSTRGRVLKALLCAISTPVRSLMTDAVSTRTILPLAEALGAAFGALPQVAAVALAGSYASRVADAQSDIDLYVYADTPIPIDRRTAIMLQFTDQGVLDNQFWEPGDEQHRITAILA